LSTTGLDDRRSGPPKLLVPPVLRVAVSGTDIMTTRATTPTTSDPHSAAMTLRWRRRMGRWVGLFLLVVGTMGHQGMAFLSGPAMRRPQISITQRGAFNRQEGSPSPITLPGTVSHYGRGVTMMAKRGGYSNNYGGIFKVRLAFRLHLHQVVGLVYDFDLI